MGKIKKPNPVKLSVGFIFADPQTLENAIFRLKKRFGKIDFESPVLTFNHTDYYEKEFGAGLKRKFISFEKLIQPEKLADAKLFTDKIEQHFTAGGKRTINIDPGILTLSKLVLASTKDFTHRIYLKKGIFAEITLFYQDKSYRPWGWTFPDYKTDEYIKIFCQIREIYSSQINRKGL